MDAQARPELAQHGQRPTGTVTFLFSDIEGSTQRWERDRSAMQEAVRRHDELMRAAVAAHGGHVFKTIGDAFCVAFWAAPEAVAAALDAQRALGASDWSGVDGLHVRMALHAGTAEERDGDYFGPAVNRVARLLAIAHGGQVVVSGITADLVQGEMPRRSSLRDLGAHRLRDLTTPEQVYQLIAPDLPSDFPPLRSLDALPNNLPLQVTAFVGRDEAIAEIIALLDKSRLVTLVGTGGVGKTRTALQVAADLLDGSGDGVWFVEFAPLAEPSLVAGAVATALGVAIVSDRPVLDAVLAYLRNRRLLLVLDNCEHVVEEAARVVDAIVHGCPQVKLLVTSREGLNVAGERVYRMPSLRVPPPEERLSAIDAAAYESVALFVDRAAAADGRFVLTDDNAPIVADICRRLDGIALAIELAAPRVKVLAVQQLAQRLDERFRILTGGSRSALPRQQTMRALIDWSYDLLSEPEKTIFRRVAVFAGGWTLEAASEICADDRIESWDVLELLSALVDKSLVTTELSGSHQRYRLLESMRQYAREHLTKASDAHAVMQRHATFYCRAAEDAFKKPYGAPTDEWFPALAPELDNLRAALTWTITERNDLAIGAAAVASSFQLFDKLSLFEEGLKWLFACEADASLPVEIKGRLQYATGFLCNNSGRLRRALEADTRAVELLRQTDDRTMLARALMAWAGTNSQLGLVEAARRVGSEGLELARAIDNPLLTANALRNYAAALPSAEIGEARMLFGQCTEILRGLGRHEMLAYALVWWGEAEAAAGSYERAIALARESCELGTATTLLVCQHNIAAYALSMGDLDQGLPAAREALAGAATHQLPAMTAYGVLLIALLAAASDVELAARLAGYGQARLAQIDAQYAATESVPLDMLMSRLHEALDEPVLARLLSEGAGWSEDTALAAARTV